MKKVVSSIALSGLLLYAAGCGKNTAETKSMDILYTENGVPVKVITLDKGNMNTEYSFNVDLKGIEETDAVAMVEDKVEKINFKVGDYVQKDEIVVIFPTDNPATQYYQIKVSVEHAETTLKRIENLYANGGISLQELENTKTQCEVARANWRAVQQSVKVKAPISGTISKMNVRESDNVKRGDVLFTIAKTQKLKAEIWATEDQISDIKKGNKVTASWRDISILGKVVQVDTSLDTKKKAFRVIAEFDNPGQKMMNGVNADVSIICGTQKSTIITERRNLVREGDTWFAYIAKDSTAVKTAVVTGKQKNLDIEVIKGLNSGDRLITEGISLLSDGAKINIVDK